ncbi:unnamed protein product [Callosobruchus maculatus]|uniref:Uncharacterized protein n=1 Tax=Callosobruchus maculatus TaxID=64391 RepID=A0A653D1R5_CALMS|nr:unnamed protein product [Callosobruchus maculatus]
MYIRMYCGGVVRFVTLLVVAVVSVHCQFDDHHHHHHHLEEYHDYRAPPHYHYDYAVHDDHHHDYHSQHEERKHHDVKGKYELLQPDGRKRIVEYVAGKHGADYKVRYEGHSHHGGIGSQGIEG